MKSEQEIIDKNKLRDETFDKLFENKEGYLLENIAEIFSQYEEVYKKLEEILDKNSDDFDIFWDKIINIKKISYNKKNYYVIEFSSLYSLVIDIDNNIILDDNSIELNNLEFKKKVSNRELIEIARFAEYNGNIQEIINLLNNNHELLNITNDIVYQVENKNASAQISINIPSRQICLYFRADSQYLYETIWLNLSFNPGVLDVGQRISKTRIAEMAESLKKCIIPKEYFNLEMQELIEENMPKIKKRHRILE